MLRIPVWKHPAPLSDDVHAQSRPGGGFTLVELLVVIAIIGILVALLLPAIQSAREAARRTECKNHVKNIALGCLLHVDSQGFLPSGGWNYDWTADPNRGYGKDQPGSWVYDILTYVEEQALRDLGQGEPIGSGPFRTASETLHSTPIGLFYCPSRRPARPYPSESLVIKEQQWLRGIFPTLGVAKSDYAANSGDSLEWDALNFRIPEDYDEAEGFNWSRTDICSLGYSSILARDYRRCQSGVIYHRSQIKIAQLIDGTGSTYLVGEKYVNPLAYQGSTSRNEHFDWGENQSMYCGYDWDNHRVAYKPPAPGTADPVGSLYDVDFYQPLQDTPQDDTGFGRFGSAHPSGFHMAFCDGSVQSISYGIDPTTHRFLARRNDEEVIVDKDF